MRAFLMILALFASAPAALATVFVDPAGNDGNDCRSPAMACATLQGAVDHIGFGTYDEIIVAAGEYHLAAMVNVYYWRSIIIRGPGDAVGSCRSPGATLVLPPDKVAFFAQDGAILNLSCLTIRGASAGIAARQGAIVDFSEIRFVDVKQYVIANDKGMVTCAGKIHVEGASALNGFVATRGSLMNIHCAMVLPAGLSFSDFVYGGNSGTNIDMSGATFSTDGEIFSPDGSILNARGRPYTIDNAELNLGGVVVPGSEPPHLIPYGKVRSRLPEGGPGSGDAR